MRDFGNKGRSSSKGKFGGERNFKNSSYSERRSFSSPEREMFGAICDSCGRECQVPFKPNGRKPVLCNSCYKGQDEGETTYRQESNYSGNNKFSPKGNLSNKSDNRGEYSDLKKQIEFLSNKLDKVLRLLESQSSKPKSLALENPVIETAKEAVSTKVRKPRKTPVKKKK